MAGFLLELATDLAGRLGGGYTVGVSVFAGFLPTGAQDRCVVARPYMTEESIVAMGGEGATVHADIFRVQVVSRDTTVTGAESLAELVHSKWKKALEFTVLGRRYLGIESVFGPPIFLREDESHLIEFECNYRVTRDPA